MALSNIRNEPQREITESAVGLAVFAVFYVVPGTFFALHFGPWLADGDHGSCQATCATILTGLILWPFCLFGCFLAVSGVLFGTHALGDAICNLLETQGRRVVPIVQGRVLHDRLSGGFDSSREAPADRNRGSLHRVWALRKELSLRQHLHVREQAAAAYPRHATATGAGGRPAAWLAS